jgi:hypothetical protein
VISNTNCGEPSAAIQENEHRVAKNACIHLAYAYTEQLDHDLEQLTALQYRTDTDERANPPAIGDAVYRDIRRGTYLRAAKSGYTFAVPQRTTFNKGSGTISL